MNAPRPRPGILEIAPYVGGESSVAGVARVIKLASNESALGPSPAAVEAMAAAAPVMHRYPDGHCTRLRQALADRHGLNADNIVCGAGSDELISLLCRAYAGPGEQVLYSRHGFLMYPIAARTVGAEPVAAPETNLVADVEALLARVTERTRLLFLANPNNPTGTYLTGDALERLRRGLPGHVLLVLDAAYAEYVDDPDYEAGERLVDGGENVVVTRTFSKIYGLGGLRLGWAYAPAGVADVLNRMRNPFNVSAPAQEAGVAALADQAFLDRARAHNATWRAWTTAALRRLGLGVGDSAGNFVLVRFPPAPGHDAVAADAFLKRRGIIVRRMESYGLPDALRISIGLADEMQACVDAMSEFLG
ncbi:MAG: histidinol-phosphate transaminase [Rhodospirillales bacterium]|nr:MAG: histidinol-phosphate transaminase [Rhodospirillales bacterium]